MSKKIGIIALLHESNTFIHSGTTLAHFEGNLLTEGESVLDFFRGNRHEVAGFIDALQDQPDVKAVGVFAARAMPYGAITSDCWNELMSRLICALDKYGPFDGLLVAPHGATVAENAPDADGDWLSRVRKQVGPNVPVIGTLDLHANVSQLMIDSTDALFGYRTNPHLDQYEQGIIAGRTMLQTLRGEISPKQFLVQVPVCVNIERQATSEPQGIALIGQAIQLVANTPGLIDISCLYGFPYADVVEMGPCVIAVAKHDTHLAKRCARQIGDLWWNLRETFVGNLIGISQAIDEAKLARVQRPNLPVGLLDMGDNVGGGGPGDGTSIVHAWFDSWKDQAISSTSSVGKILTVIADPESVALAVGAGVGRTVNLHLGGKLAPEQHGPAICGEFEVLSISDGKFRETGTTHGGYSVFDQGTTVVVRMGQLTSITTTFRTGPMSMQQILSQNIDPNEYAVIVIKGVHAPVAAYASVCSRLIRVNTDGVTTADLNRLHFQHRRVPMFPWETTNTHTEETARDRA
jgi:microcystin degradation protein MlrC